VKHLLHQVLKKDGGTVQCPEVGEIYEAIARAAPDNTIFCETGFNVGSSAAIFLQGSYGTRSEVHSFDYNFPHGAVELLNEIYSAPGETRLHAHVGDMTDTLQEFYKSGKLCDVIFLDAKHPEDLELTKMLARGTSSLFLYHWHFRGKESKPYFTTSLNELKTFTEFRV
jgi:predicted O-methyltransferase YrrM